MYELLIRMIDASLDEGADLADVARDLDRALDYVNHRIQEEATA